MSVCSKPSKTFYKAPQRPFVSAGSEAVAIVADFDGVVAAALITFARSFIAGHLTFELTADFVVNLSELVDSVANSFASLAASP